MVKYLLIFAVIAVVLYMFLMPKKAANANEGIKPPSVVETLPKQAATLATAIENPVNNTAILLMSAFGGQATPAQTPTSANLTIV